MRTTYINAILCVFIVLLGLTLSASLTTDNDDYAAIQAASSANIDWSNFDDVHQFEDRAAKSRFWKRAPHRKFWKRSISNE